MVEMIDFRNEPEELIQKELKACERVLRSGWWILGKELKSFENEWAKWTKSPFVIGCGNGMDAIEIGLRALEIGIGDEVITTPMTAFATVLAILKVGAVPVLADIDKATAMLSPDSVLRCINRKTKAIILVHLYGQIGPVHLLKKLADQNNIYLIEDCAQAHGARYGNIQAGGFGKFASWSFYPTKNLGAIGDAGAISTADEELAIKMFSIRNYGQSVRYHHPYIGMNSRLDELQAAILLERLNYLDEWIKNRQKIARRYINEINNNAIKTLKVHSDENAHSYHIFAILCDRRVELQKHLYDSGVESLIHYPIPVHFQVPCKDIKRDPYGLKNAETHANECLSIPCHPYLNNEKINKVIEAINLFN